MALKTTPTDADVDAFLDAVEDPRKREDSRALCRLMAEETGERATLWGSSIVGFGSYHYRYASGREGDWPAVAFSPRKQNLTLYLMDGFSGYGELLERLGRHSTGKSCLYLKRLADVDEGVLREMVRRSYRHTAGS
ncbi:MAG TPA: DUF1801 domain-containing protein [Solirubrobacteraceae bacterium]|nr:DUF1801 domain-containing protein [Solirubrobacteraceae bacterium]